MSTASDARFWDRAARKYAKSRIADPEGYERTLERTKALLAPGDSVLELGCGTGSTALRLASHVGRYLATDISAEMIAIAREKLAADPVFELEFRVATAEAISREATGFDAVLGFSYLHLVADVPGTLRTIHGLLAPDGLFVTKTPCVGDMNPLIRLGLLPLMRVVGKAPQVSVFGKAALVEMIGAAGFEVVATEGHAAKGMDWRPFIVARKREG